MVYSNVALQMDRVYCSKDEEEEEDRGLELSQGDLEERIRTVYPAKSWGLGICELLFRFGNFSSYRPSGVDQNP